MTVGVQGPGSRVLGGVQGPGWGLGVSRGVLGCPGSRVQGPGSWVGSWGVQGCLGVSRGVLGREVVGSRVQGPGSWVGSWGVQGCLGVSRVSWAEKL